MAYSVLLVDDSETIREAMVRAFAMTKLPMDEILRAGNGIEALEIVKKLDRKWVDARKDKAWAAELLALASTT